MTDKQLIKFWKEFITKHPEYSEQNYCDAYYFCDNEKDANECAELVLQGVKRATASSKWWHDHNDEALPVVGDLNIVTNWSGEPLAVIRTIKVDLVPYEKITESFAATEGEGDGSLEYWKRVHWDFYTREMSPYGVRPSKDMLIVCEEFERVDV